MYALSRVFAASGTAARVARIPPGIFGFSVSAFTVLSPSALFVFSDSVYMILILAVFRVSI